MEHERTQLRTGAIAIHLELISPKNITSKRLRSDIGATQASWWPVPYRIKDAHSQVDGHGSFSGPFEVGEAGAGGNRHDISDAKRAGLAAVSRGRVGRKQIWARSIAQSARSLRRGFGSRTKGRTKGFIKDHEESEDSGHTHDAPV